MSSSCIYIQKLKDISVDNKYFNLYVTLIKHSWSKEEYCEKHHILPTSISKCPDISKKDKKNLCIVPLRVHFILHKLLVKFVKSKSHKIKMMLAINAFQMTPTGFKRVLNSSQLKYVNRMAESGNKGLKWIHNGSEKRRIPIDDEIPDGWEYGTGSTWNKGLIYTNEMKANRPKLFGESNPFFNKKHTNATQQKMRKPKHYDDPLDPIAHKAFSCKSDIFLFQNLENNIFDCLTLMSFIKKYGDHPYKKDGIVKHKKWSITKMEIPTTDYADYKRYVVK